MNAYDRTPAVSNAMDLSPHIYESIGNGKSFTVGVDMDEKPPDYMESIGGIQGAAGGGGAEGGGGAALQTWSGALAA